MGQLARYGFKGPGSHAERSTAEWAYPVFLRRRGLLVVAVKLPSGCTPAENCLHFIDHIHENY